MDSLANPNYDDAWTEFCQNTFAETNVSRSSIFQRIFMGATF